MPFVFGIAGILLIVAGVRGTVTGSNPSLVSLIKDDFTGQPNYFEWVVAIFLIGAIGYIPKLEPISRGFMAIVIVGLFLSNKGFFTQLTKQTQQQPQNSALTATPTNEGVNSIGTLPTLPSVTQFA